MIFTCLPLYIYRAVHITALWVFNQATHFMMVFAEPKIHKIIHDLVERKKKKIKFVLVCKIENNSLYYEFEYTLKLIKI